MRVGGRLAAANMSQEFKHPQILPAKNILTTLIISDIHIRNMHAGTQLTLHTLRQRFWVPNARNTIKQIIHRCVKCFRYAKSNHARQIMGNLPSPRITPTRAFLSSGVDYAGPITLRMYKGRCKKTSKGYICLFVCLSTRAVHLEMVSDMTTEAFVAAFRRFTSRRGKCADLYSDCGTNFVGANSELLELRSHLIKKGRDPQLASIMADEGTNWHFIPPGSPNFGGLWESAVKSVKYHIRRTIGPTLLTYEEMTTVLCQVEACLNSRPLCAISDDPDDLLALTPGHFLIGEPLNMLPDPDLTKSPENRLNRWQLLQRMTQNIWDRWHKEYISSLQNLPKWQNASANVQINDLVLVSDERLPPAKWLLGRVTQIHPGQDNKVRVVTVKHSGGEIKRNTRKLCVLPIEK